MSSASKLAIVDKLLPLLEAFGASRSRQTEIRRAMKAAACQHPDRFMGFVDPMPVACFTPNGRTPWCEACRQHDQLFHQLMAERKANKKRLHRIERLAQAFAQPEPEEPPAPKELLELIHRLEQEDSSAAAASILDGDTEGANH